MVDAVVIGLSATGLAVIRALGRRGLRVVGVDPRRWEIGHASRYARTSTDLSLSGLRRLAGDGRPAVFAAGDPELSWALAHAPALAGFLSLPPSWEDGSAAGALDKRRLYARCQTLGVPLPRTWFPDTLEAVAAIAEEARFPLLVKPARGAASPPVGAGKVRLCVDAAALRSAPLGTVVQEWIPGPESALQVCALNRRADGSFGPVVTARKRRQWPPEVGSGTWVEITEDAEVAAWSRALVEALGLTGPAAVEWKRSGGRLVHVEVNPRPALWFGLADAVVLDAFASQIGRPPPDVPVRRARWQYLLRDLVAGRGSALRAGDLLAVEAADDPLPGVLGVPYTAALWALRRRGRR